MSSPAASLAEHPHWNGHLMLAGHLAHCFTNLSVGKAISRRLAVPISSSPSRSSNPRGGLLRQSGAKTQTGVRSKRFSTEGKAAVASLTHPALKLTPSWIVVT